MCKDQNEDINIQNLGMAFGDPLFTDLTLTISKGYRIGLVAVNGRGKSTSMGCMLGHVKQTTGTIIRAHGFRVGHVLQNIPANALIRTRNDWVLCALPQDQADYESWRCDVVLDELKVPTELHHTPLADLGGGWKRIGLLAATWIIEPDILPLDQLTNHLDLHRIALLQDWLGALSRETPVVIISHDRAFLDATTNRTLFLCADCSRAFPLAFTPARAELEQTEKADECRFANDQTKNRATAQLGGRT